MKTAEPKKPLDIRSPDLSSGVLEQQRSSGPGRDPCAPAHTWTGSSHTGSLRDNSGRGRNNRRRRASGSSRRSRSPAGSRWSGWDSETGPDRTLGRQAGHALMPCPAPPGAVLTNLRWGRRRSSSTGGRPSLQRHTCRAPGHTGCRRGSSACGRCSRRPKQRESSTACPGARGRGPGSAHSPPGTGSSRSLRCSAGSRWTRRGSCSFCQDKSRKTLEKRGRLASRGGGRGRGPGGPHLEAPPSCWPEPSASWGRAAAMEKHSWSETGHTWFPPGSSGPCPRSRRPAGRREVT